MSEDKRKEYEIITTNLACCVFELLLILHLYRSKGVTGNGS